MTRLRLLTAAALLCAALPSAAVASPSQESMFQDDPQLVYGAPEQVEQTLDRLAALGVDRLRISVFWQLVAPDDQSARKPAFDAADPAAYPPRNWERYDRLVRGAKARGIGVNFNLTSPIPRWAASESPREDIQKTFGPSASEFGQFVRAVGTRYSGTYAGLPRVDYWSVWNEPNQAGWLTPQWSNDPRDPKRQIEVAPHTYRGLVAAAHTALADTGHGTDTFLIGETAPKGQQDKRGITQSIDPLRFLRSVYCLDNNLQFFRGTSAEVRGCPQSEPAKTLVAQNPGLFRSTGYAHHPYELLLAPTRESSAPDWVTIADLGDLSRELRRIYQRYGQAMPERRGVPLYLTEYGYQTKPDPLSVSFARQAAYINQSDYIAFRNPLVRAVSQFLLVDDAPVPGVDPRKNPRDAYLTFQSGLRTLGGKPKPSQRAYRTPLHVVDARIRPGARARVFGQVRPARAAQRERVRIQWRRKGSKRWRTLATRTVSGPQHFLNVRLRVPASGALRLRWQDGRRPVVS
ncbi:MAG: cellulase family glycosylhydrolase, partial [Solirubrobacterales bacterium]|nr:cellulase family glycosylhydrolase [Solirubrobacterales bacterium]